MLSDFKRPHPCTPPSLPVSSDTCRCKECVYESGWVRGSKFTDREEVTCMHFSMHRRLSLKHLHTLTARSSFNSRHIRCVDKPDSVLRWQAGCVGPSAEWYSIIRNQKVTISLFPSTLHHLLSKWRHNAIFTYESTAKQIAYAVCLLRKHTLNNYPGSRTHLLFLNVPPLTGEH